MCTLAAKKINNGWFLAKTRDPVPWMRIDDEIKLFDTSSDKTKKLIIQNPDTKEDGYYGGINDYGVTFVATFVPVAEMQISYIRRPYVRLILDAKTALEAVDIIKSFNPKIGGNFLVADKDICYEIEGAPLEYFIQEIDQPIAKTNHFLHLQTENLQMKVPGYKQWTENRLDRAKELINTAKSLTDLENLLKDRKNAANHSAICMVKGEWDYNPPTSSAFIFDTAEHAAYYCKGSPLDNPFTKYSI